MNILQLEMARDDIQATTGERHMMVPRLAAGLPLLIIGLAHVFDSAAPMRPLVEAAGLPVAALLSPLAVAVEIVAGFLLLVGLYARIGALLTIPTMAVAIYAHLTIGVWPNEGAGEPPLALPIVVLVAATYILLRGAGAWSLDRQLTKASQK